MRSVVAEVLAWIITWIPWFGFGLALLFVAVGVVGMDDDTAGRDFFLLSIAVTLLTGLFVALVVLQ